MDGIYQPKLRGPQKSSSVGAMRFPGRSAPIDGEWRVRLIYVSVPFFQRNGFTWVYWTQRPKGWMMEVTGGVGCPLGEKHRAVKPESE